MIIAFALLLFVLLPVLATRYGADSRPDFAGRPDWRARNA